MDWEGRGERRAGGQKVVVGEVVYCPREWLLSAHTHVQAQAHTHNMWVGAGNK